MSAFRNLTRIDASLQPAHKLSFLLAAIEPRQPDLSPTYPLRGHGRTNDQANGPASPNHPRPISSAPKYVSSATFRPHSTTATFLPR